MESNHYAEAVSLADRALQLLDDGVRVNGPRDWARAEVLNYRGLSSGSLGDTRGQDDVRESIALNPHIAVYRNNLGYLLAVNQGLGSAFAEVEEGVPLAILQGDSRHALACHDTLLCFGFLLGRWDDVLDRAASVSEQLSKIGDDVTLMSNQLWVAWTLLLRGRADATTQVADLLQGARRIGDPQILLPAIVIAGSAAAAAGNHIEADRFLREIEHVLPAAGELDLPFIVPAIVRLAVWAHDLKLAGLLAVRRSSYPAGLASAASVRGAIHEAQAPLHEAALHYLEAAQRWEALDGVVEHAYALLGLGRSRLAAGEVSGAADVREARTIFNQLGAGPLVAEADQLLGEQQQISS